MNFIVHHADVLRPRELQRGMQGLSAQATMEAELGGGITGGGSVLPEIADGAGLRAELEVQPAQY